MEVNIFPRAYAELFPIERKEEDDPGYMGSMIKTTLHFRIVDINNYV